ncbi:hypothetical protein LCGC14_1448920, partial [marine sediment metagenome]
RYAGEVPVAGYVIQETTHSDIADARWGLRMLPVDMMVPLSLRKVAAHKNYWKRKGKDPCHRTIRGNDGPCVLSYYQYIGWDVYPQFAYRGGIKRPALAFGQGTPSRFFALSVDGVPSVCFLDATHAMNLKKGIELLEPSKQEVVVLVVNS